MQKMLINETLPPVPGMSGGKSQSSSSTAAPAAATPQRAPAAPQRVTPAARPAPAANQSRPGAFGVTAGGPSGAEAASSWLQSAMAEAETSDTHKAVMVRMRIDCRRVAWSVATIAVCNET